MGELLRTIAGREDYCKACPTYMSQVTGAIGQDADSEQDKEGMSQHGSIPENSFKTDKEPTLHRRSSAPLGGTLGGRGFSMYDV